MAKVFKFTKKDRNRYRKVYRYIRKKPSFEFCSSEQFEMIAGFVSFSDTNQATYTFDSGVSFTNVPVMTVTSVDSEGNDQADVNVFITAISTTAATIETSAPFTGRVHFIIMGQD